VIALAAEAARTTLVTFASSSERSRHRRNRLSPSPKGWSIETSLDLVPPLLALPACLSPPSCHIGASTPGHRCKQRWPSGRGFHASTPVPPTWSLTTSTACSAPEPAGLLRPASDLGVHCVSYLPSRASEEAVGTGFGLPRSAVIPFKGFPSSAAVPHHCGRCLPACCRVPEHPDRARASLRAPVRGPAAPEGTAVGRSRRWRCSGSPR